MSAPAASWGRYDYVALAPAPRLFLWEAPFWLILLFCALAPSSWVPWIEWGDVPASSPDLLLILGSSGYAVAAGLAALCGRCYAPGRRHAPGRRRGAPGRWLLGGFVALVVYAAASVAWSGLGDSDSSAMLYTLLLALATSLLSWLLLSGYTPGEAHHFLWRLTVFVALVSVLYAAESMLALGLRSDSGQSLIADFGIERVRGPLFGASTGYMALLPALAFAIEHVLHAASRRILGVLLVLALAVALLGLGSRAALLLIAVFLLMLSSLVKNPRQKLCAVALMVLLTGCAGAVVFSRASTDRFHSFEDSWRRATHRTAWGIVRQQPLADSLLGTGYGGVWPWYLADARLGAKLMSGDNLTLKPAGISLYHPHSTILLLAVELGLAGCLFLALLGLAIGRLFLRGARAGGFHVLACGLAASGLALFFDLFLFKNAKVTLIWWLYLNGALALAQAQRGSPRRCDSA